MPATLDDVTSDLRELLDEAGGANELLKGIFHVAQQHTLILKELTQKGVSNTPSAPASGQKQAPDSVETQRKPSWLSRTRLGRSRFGRMAGAVLGRATRRGVGGLAARGVGMAARGAVAAGAAGGAAGGVVGGVVGGLTLAAVALKAFHMAVDRATEGALAAARQYAEVSGSMAAVLAERDLKELLRDQRMGEAQAGSTRALAEAEQRRKDATEPLSNAFADLKNNVLAFGNDVLADVLTPIAEAVKGIHDYFKDEEAKKQQPVGLAATMPSIMDHAKQLDDKVKMMHEESRRAAGRATGFSAPAGGVTALGLPRV